MARKTNEGDNYEDEELIEVEPDDEGLSKEEIERLEENVARLAEAAAVVRTAPGFEDLVENLALIARDAADAWTQSGRPSRRGRRASTIPDWVAEDVIPCLRYQRKMTLAAIARHLSEPPYDLHTADGKPLSTSHIQYALERRGTRAAA
jgi:hypothetical protein